MAERDWLMILIGALGYIILSHQVPILRQLSETRHELKDSNVKLEEIEGIDLKSLTIVKQRFPDI